MEDHGKITLRLSVSSLWHSVTVVSPNNFFGRRLILHKQSVREQLSYKDLFHNMYDYQNYPTLPNSVL